jgi:hypothetical protein
MDSRKEKEKSLVAARFELARVFPTGSQVKILKSSALDHSATLPIHDGSHSSLMPVMSSEYINSMAWHAFPSEHSIISVLMTDYKANSNNLVSPTRADTN